MLTINFYADSDLKDYSQPVADYQRIWQEDGQRIVDVWEQITGLKFQESYINAVIFDHISHSHPLSLRNHEEEIRRKTTLVHELGHRILAKRVAGGRHASSLQSHKLLDLVLYEVFVELYGEAFANNAVEWDSNLPKPEYKEAWDWALAFSKDERKIKFLEVLEKGYGLL